MAEYELFLPEDQAIRKVALALDSGQLSLDEAKSMLNQLFLDYQKLLRQTKQLVKLSDRREKELNALNGRLKEMTQALAYQASHDLLTKALNRAGIGQAIEEALREEDAFTLIVFDVDYFKRVNDSFGHPAGDAVLSGLAALVQAHLPGSGKLGRLGGEEFVILLLEPILEVALRIAETVRQAVASARFAYGDERISVTISLGLALCRRGETLAGSYGRADRSLYAAKQAGRNCIEICCEDMSC